MNYKEQIFQKTTAKKNKFKPLVFELYIKDPPEPLVMLINPRDFNKAFASKIEEQRVRWTGDQINFPYIFQVHHDELETINVTGKSAMFFTDKGVTRIDRTKSLGYNNIEKLVAFYRNNGTNRNKKPGRSIDPCSIETVGSVIMTYNAYMYRGYFNNFSVSEEERMPFNVDYSFDFKVLYTFNSNELRGFHRDMVEDTSNELKNGMIDRRRVSRQKPPVSRQKPPGSFPSYVDT